MKYLIFFSLFLDMQLFGAPDSYKQSIALARDSLKMKNYSLAYSHFKKASEVKGLVDFEVCSGLSSSLMGLAEPKAALTQLRYCIKNAKSFRMRRDLSKVLVRNLEKRPDLKIIEENFKSKELQYSLAQIFKNGTLYLIDIPVNKLAIHIQNSHFDNLHKSYLLMLLSYNKKSEISLDDVLITYLKADFNSSRDALGKDEAELLKQIVEDHLRELLSLNSGRKSSEFKKRYINLIDMPVQVGFFARLTSLSRYSARRVHEKGPIKASLSGNREGGESVVQHSGNFKPDRSSRVGISRPLVESLQIKYLYELGQYKKAVALFEKNQNYHKAIDYYLLALVKVYKAKNFIELNAKWNRAFAKLTDSKLREFLTLEFAKWNCEKDFAKKCSQILLDHLSRRDLSNRATWEKFLHGSILNSFKKNPKAYHGLIHALNLARNTFDEGSYIDLVPQLTQALNRKDLNQFLSAKEYNYKTRILKDYIQAYLFEQSFNFNKAVEIYRKLAGLSSSQLISKVSLSRGLALTRENNNFDYLYFYFSNADHSKNLKDLKFLFSKINKLANDEIELYKLLGVLEQISNPRLLLEYNMLYTKVLLELGKGPAAKERFFKTYKTVKYAALFESLEARVLL